MNLGKLGVWTALDGMSAAAGLDIARLVERLGYAAPWMPEGRGRNVLVHCAFLLAGTERLIIAPGIANIYARDPMAMGAAQNGLAGRRTIRIPGRCGRRNFWLRFRVQSTYFPKFKCRHQARE